MEHLEEKRYANDIRLAKIEATLDDIKPKITTIFDLLNEKVMPQIYTVPFLVKGFWVMVTAVVGLAVWAIKQALAK